MQRGELFELPYFPPFGVHDAALIPSTRSIGGLGGCKGLHLTAGHRPE